ncbi:MAG: thioredoxin family protein [Nannocystales bacterium]
MHRWVVFSLLVTCSGTSPSAEEQPQETELRWQDVTSEAALAKLAAEAQATDRALMLDVRADWCVPCRDLESKTFTDPEVAALLGRRFVLARLDVTDPKPEAEALQLRVGGTAMPWVLFWPMTAEQAGTFAKGEVPPPAKTVSTFVSAQELLPSLEGFGTRP